MDVLKKVVAKPGWITSHVVAMLFVAIASCSAVFCRVSGPEVPRRQPPVPRSISSISKTERPCRQN